MMKYLSRRILFLTALYVCIIFGIFALQFTNGNAFSLSIGSMMVSGTTETSDEGKNRPLLPLHIGANGIDFFLDEDNPLLAFTSEKTSVALKVTAISETSSSFTIRFTENVTVTFASAKRGESDIITINALIPAKYQKVVFPYKMTRSAHVEKKDSLTLISSGKKQFVFLGASVQNVTGNAVRLLPISYSSPVVYYQTYLPAKGLLIEDLVTLPGATEVAYSSAIEKYAAQARIYFKDAVSAGSLSEGLVASYIAEMGRIGMYRAAVESIPEAYRNGASRTYQTNTFLNNLQKTYASLVIKERDDRSALSRKLSENNSSVFEYPSLVPYLVDRGSTILLKDVSRVASGITMSSVTALQAAGILEAMLDFPLYAAAEENTLLSLADSCERKLKASLVRQQDRLYVSDDGKTVDTLATLQIAQILLRYGAENGEKEAWVGVGRLLVNSMVAAMSPTAFIPAMFTLSGDDTSGASTELVAKTDLMLDPSTVYPALVIGNTWYPHSLSLSRQAGTGVWAWTSAQSVKITKTADGIMKITTQFPQGETHYMVLRGIKPFYRILIYGIDFRTDARFESYNSSGYVYNEQTETLYLKMRHKAEYEDILIYSGKDPNVVISDVVSTEAVPAN